VQVAAVGRPVAEGPTPPTTLQGRRSQDDAVDAVKHPFPQMMPSNPNRSQRSAFQTADRRHRPRETAAPTTTATTGAAEPADAATPRCSPPRRDDPVQATAHRRA